MPEPHLQINGVTKTLASRAGPRDVLRNISLTIAKGERIAVVGQNGSGKSTLLRVLLGVDEVTSGEVIFATSDQERNVAFIPQDYRNALFPWLRLDTNLAMNSSRLRSLAVDDDSPHLTAARNEAFLSLCRTFRVDIDLKKYPYQLSGGEQQLFLLACAMHRKPALLVLDESLSAIDFARKKLVQEYLADWCHRSNATLVFASHDFEEAVMLADRVVVFDGISGRLKTTISIDLPWPRTVESRRTTAFRAAVDSIITVII